MVVCLVGGASGGCLLPIILFMLAAAWGDTTGLLFWPIISVPVELIGLALGV